jgi:6-phosphogluconolactonase
MTPQFHISPDSLAAATECAVSIASILREAIELRGKATLAVSGGSTPRLMFDALVNEHLDWTRIDLFFVDERPVPPGDPQSNYTLCETHLLKPAVVPATSIHRIEAERGAEVAAEVYTREISMSFELKAGELPEFDVIQCGMGPDCHTASLFPGEPMIDNRTRLVGALPVEKMHQTRITLLPGVLLNARRIALLVSGADKAWAMKQALHGPDDSKQFPAQLVVRHSRAVDLFADTAAAAEIG